MLKFIIIGDSAVGKSCLMMQFTENTFKEEYKLTVGADFGTKTLDINGRPVKLQLWDTAGQETYKSVTRSYYRGAAVALVMYDVTRRESFDSLEQWIEEAKNYAGRNVVLVLIGNKIDLEREVSAEEAAEFAQRHQIQAYEVSAKADVNVQEVFIEPAKVVLARIESGEYKLINDNLSVGSVPSKNTRRCHC